jgi:myosin heavy subunit
VASGEETKKLKEDDLFTVQADVLEENVHDLLNLTLLHDSALLRCLYIRYMNDVVYTNIGAIVVALNPFNFKIPHYMDDQMPKYLAEGPVIEKNIPYSWAQAHNTYNEMRSACRRTSASSSQESLARARRRPQRL